MDRILAELQKINSRFDNLETRFDKLETRFDKLETRFDGLEKQVNENTQILRALEHKVDVIKAQQEALFKDVVESKRDSKVAKYMANAALDEVIMLSMNINKQ